MAKMIRKDEIEREVNELKKEDIDFILQEGEGQFIEFKENFDSKNLAKA